MSAVPGVGLGGFPARDVLEHSELAARPPLHQQVEGPLLGFGVGDVVRPDVMEVLENGDAKVPRLDH